MRGCDSRAASVFVANNLALFPGNESSNQDATVYYAVKAARVPAVSRHLAPAWRSSESAAGRDGAGSAAAAPAASALNNDSEQPDAKQGAQGVQHQEA